MTGNDAHFALKALLMIAVRDGQMTLTPETMTPADGELFRALDAIAHAPCALAVWTDAPPVTSTPPKARAKLGIKAKRRLRAGKKAAKRASQELPGDDELARQDSKGEHQDEALVA